MSIKEKIRRFKDIKIHVIDEQIKLEVFEFLTNLDIKWNSGDFINKNNYNFRRASYLYLSTTSWLCEERIGLSMSENYWQDNSKIVTLEELKQIINGVYNDYDEENEIL